MRLLMLNAIVMMNAIGNFLFKSVAIGYRFIRCFRLALGSGVRLAVVLDVETQEHPEKDEAVRTDDPHKYGRIVAIYIEELSAVNHHEEKLNLEIRKKEERCCGYVM